MVFHIFPLRLNQFCGTGDRLAWFSNPARAGEGQAVGSQRPAPPELREVKFWFNYSIIPVAGERGRQVGRSHTAAYRWMGVCTSPETSYRSEKCLKSLEGTVRRQIDLKSGRIFEAET